jgi:glutaryl-CoA dehydrogenase (non-decarboxylating)
MDFNFTEDQKMVQDMAKSFAENEVAPYVDEDEENHFYRRDILTKMGELGLLGWSLPEEYGGNGMGWMEGIIAQFEIAKVHTSWRLSISGNNWGPAMTINKFGTEEQKQKWIPGFLDASLVGSFAITEPNFGSDVAGMKTFAEDKGDHYVVNGTKMWISGGHVSDAGLLYAVTEKGAGAKGLSCFIVDYNNTEGVTRNPIHTKVGMFAAPTSEMVYENVIIPKENLIGKEGAGFPICMWQLNNTRMGCANGAASLSAACLEGAVQYAQERTQFGKPIGKYQLIQDQITSMKLEDDAARLLVLRAAQLKDEGKLNQQQVSIAKLFSCHAAVNAANLAMKIYGSYGYSTEYPCGRWLRDAKQFETLEGTSNMHTMIVANIELGFAPNR